MRESLLRNLVEKIAGKSALPIIEVLLKKKDVSENVLAKRSGMFVNEVRNILYKLSSEGIVSFVRKKDKRKGWFVYFWSLNEEKSLLKLEKEIIEEINSFKLDLERRMKERFYYCDICKTEINEEKALEDEFVCPECASPYSLVNNNTFVEEIKKNISRKEKHLEEIRKEISFFREKQLKSKERQLKKELKKSVKKKKILKTKRKK